MSNFIALKMFLSDAVRYATEEPYEFGKYVVIIGICCVIFGYLFSWRVSQAIKKRKRVS